MAGGRRASANSIRFREIALVAVALAFGAIAFAQSYLRWLDPIVDAGRDLYIPEQLRLGANLYADILYFYPPLTPYLLALVTSVTGSSLAAYIGIGLATALLTALVLWLIARPLAGAYASACVLLVFFSFSVAGTGGWGSNYFFPYAHAAVFAMLFFLGGVALLLRGHHAVATLLLLAASWTKMEFAAFSVAVVVFAVITRRLRPRWLALFLGGLATTVFVAVAAFGVDALRTNVLPPSLLGGASAHLFYRSVTGTDAWQSNLALAVRGALLIAAFALLLRLWDRRSALRAPVVIALVVCGWALANDAFFRAWTVLQLALLPFAIRRPREPLALLLLVSLCASSRIYLNLVPTWYGFVFALPVLVLIVYVLFEWLPQSGLYSRRMGLLWAPLFVAIAVSGLLAARRAYSEAFPVATARGTYYDTSPGRAAQIGALLRHLERRGAQELVAMPEGLALNYLARIPTPLRHQTFTPVEIAGEEKSIVRELAARRPQYVVIVPRDVREFGYRGFGVDYGRDIVAWLQANYVVEARFGAIVLLRVRA